MSYKGLSHFASSYRSANELWEPTYNSFTMDEADLDADLAKMSKKKK